MSALRKVRMVFTIGTSSVALVGRVRALRAARRGQDWLAYADAAANLAAIVTGVAMAYRALRAAGTDGDGSPAAGQSPEAGQSVEEDS